MASDSGWNIPEALARLRASADPYIWDQGKELFRRGAVEDFQVLPAGAVQVIILDPRDARRFFVTVERDREGRTRARCECPYRLEGFCRHQVAALEYLRSVAEGEAAAEPTRERPREDREASEAGAGRRGLSLYELVPSSLRVRTAPDGSLLRVVLRSLGSDRAPHRVGLQLFTGTGWTELRTPDVRRWIERGAPGPHPRDLALAALLGGEPAPRSEVDSETLSAILFAVAGTEALVDRTGERLRVSLRPYELVARLERARDGIAVKLLCRSREGEDVPFEGTALVPSTTPWVQVEDGAFHPLEAGASGPFLARLQAEDYSEISGEALDRLLSEGLPLLERICCGRVEEEPGLIEEVEGVQGARLCLEGTLERLEGALEFAYGPDWVPAEKARLSSSRVVEGTVRRFPPAGQSLVRARKELEALGFRLEAGRWTIEGPGALARILAPRPQAFVRIELPESLRSFDLVERAPVLEVRVAARWEGEEAGSRAPAGGGAVEVAETSPPSGTLGFRPRSGIAWLEVSGSLKDGDRVLEIDEEGLRAAVEENPSGVLELQDGTVLGLKHPAVRSLAELLKAGRPTGREGARSLRMELPEIARFFGDTPGVRVEFDAGARRLADELRGEAAPGLGLEPSAEALLRPYQREALRWFGALSRWGLSGILADEMGLGKTVMALAHLFGRPRGAAATERSEGLGTALVVCPSSLVFNWLDETHRFFPSVRAVGLQGETRAARERILREDWDLIVTSYALLRRDRELFEAREFRAVILDEAHHVKNPESQTAQAAFALRARERWALTGTPIENHLGELWSLFRFAMPGFLGDAVEFAKAYAEPIARGEKEPLEALRSRIRPFLLRRTKAQVLGELPPLIEQVERVPMTPAQRALYESYLERARADLQDADPERSRFQILAALTRLRQICCHPKLVLEGEEPPAPLEEEGLEGGKFALLRELLEAAVEGGHRVLLYSQFTSLLDLVEGLLEELGLRRARLDGSTRDRETEVRRFTSDPAIPVFLISLKAGGLGLNLAQADTVILYDPWWNPQAEAQAASRAHRIGQTVPVHVHKLITAGTVEEKILELQASKRSLARSVVEGSEDPFAALSLEELRGLLLGERR